MEQATATATAPAKVKMTLVGLDGNAFNLMGQFRRNARRQGWKSEEIQQVLDKAMAGDYSHLLCTLMDNTEEPDQDESESTY